MAGPTSAELVLINQFRNEMRGILDEERLAQDYFLLRWIRAREHNLPKAKEMFVNHLKWYKEKNVAAFLTTTRSLFYKEHFYFPATQGHDHSGRPLFVVLPGRWKIREMLREGDPEKILLEFVRHLEDLLVRIDEARAAGLGGAANGGIVQAIGIADYYGFGLAQANSWPAISKILEMTRAFEGQYPETIAKIYFINCPRIFLWVVPLIKKVFSEKTAGKLEVFGTDSADWWPVLSEFIDPKFLGELHRAKV